MKLFQKLMLVFENHGKHRTMAMLRRMPEEQLRDIGISPALLAAGVKAWPWQEPSDDQITVSQYQVELAAVRVENVQDAAGAKLATSESEQEHKSAA